MTRRTSSARTIARWVRREYRPVVLLRAPRRLDVDTVKALVWGPARLRPDSGVKYVDVKDAVVALTLRTGQVRAGVLTAAAVAQRLGCQVLRVSR